MTRTLDPKRKLSVQQFNLGRQVKRRPLAALLFFLLLAPPTALFVAQAQSPARISQTTLTKQQALDSLNGLLTDSIEPAAMNQTRGLTKREFTVWMNQSNFSRSYKNEMRKQFEPIMAAARFEAVLLKGVKVKGSDKTTNVVIVGVLPILRQRLATDAFIIYEHGLDGGPTTDGRPKFELCHYDKCYCVNPENCSCEKMTASKPESGDCPVSNCDGCSTSEGGGGKGTVRILEAISIF